VIRPVDAARPPAVRTPRGNTVLVAEDNEALLVVATRVLESAGYRVLTARDGVEAVEVLRARGEAVDLLITDVTMPRMSGHELATHFTEIQPGGLLLFMTGSLDEDSVPRSFDPTLSILQKPFSAQALIDRVKQIIGAAA
jgi:CheY-like chemotaxis protein